MQHKEQQGYATFAQNSADVDYLRLAYLQALNIKATQKLNKYAVIVDQNTLKEVTDTHRKVFDYVIELPETNNHAMANEPLAFWLTPFKETIKLESDLLMPRSIDHWWNTFRLKDVFLSTGCRNYKQELSNVRKYRKLFDDNDLPDVYNGLMYFRFSRTATDFFTTAQNILQNWGEVKKNFIGIEEESPSTDVLYAITAHIVGRENCTAPSLDFVNFVHLKSGIRGWSDARSVFETVVYEQQDNILRINNVNQYHPLHYYDKEHIVENLVKYYESSRT